MIILVSKFSKVYNKLPIRGKNKIAYIANAKDEQRKRIFTEKYMNVFRKLGHEISEIDLRKFQKEELYGELLKYEIIYVAGGNTFHLLDVMRSSGFTEILNDLLDKEIIYVGESAGAVIMGPSIEPMKPWDKNETINLKDYNGLCYVDFVFLPHYDDEKCKRIIQRIEKEYEDKFRLRKFTDYEGVVVEGDSVRMI